ncbi:MAG: hypothetical protein J1F20_05890 [Muribaculaceae bacterium]|nr:hypothetical protein [Muribaculaceae bacterium]
MNGAVYTGIILFAIGLFVWLFGISKSRGLQNGFAPVSRSTIRRYQIIGAVGAVLFFGGLILAVLSFG